MTSPMQCYFNVKKDNDDLKYNDVKYNEKMSLIKI